MGFVWDLWARLHFRSCEIYLGLNLWGSKVAQRVDVEDPGSTLGSTLDAFWGSSDSWARFWGALDLDQIQSQMRPKGAKTRPKIGLKINQNF